MEGGHFPIEPLTFRGVVVVDDKIRKLPPLNIPRWGTRHGDSKGCDIHWQGERLMIRCFFLKICMSKFAEKNGFLLEKLQNLRNSLKVESSNWENRIEV